MSEMQGDAPLSEPAQAALTAGGLLRQARLAKGLHIAALATSIKVAPRKLELLEADRFDELPGATFTRALAQTVCRTLKIDPAPVLALLPQPAELGLSNLSQGLNAPFRDKPGRRVPNDIPFLKSPVLLGAAVLALASAALYLLPAGWVDDIGSTARQDAGTTPVPAAPSVVTTTLPPQVTHPAAPETSPASPGVSSQAASEPAAAPVSPSAPLLPSAPAQAPAPASAAPQASGVLLLRASAESWVEVIDGRGNPLVARLLQPGETVGLDGPSPLKVRIGNASATQVSFRGRPVELVPTRDNVAKLELR